MNYLDILIHIIIVTNFSLGRFFANAIFYIATVHFVSSYPIMDEFDCDEALKISHENDEKGRYILKEYKGMEYKFLCEYMFKTKLENDIELYNLKRNISMYVRYSIWFHIVFSVIALIYNIVSFVF